MQPVEVWSVDSAGCPAGLLEVLDDAEQERHARAVRRGRPGYAAGRVALRHLLGALLDIAPQSVAFSRHCASCGRDGHGRPTVAGLPFRELDFSVATISTVTLIAVVRQGRVGVDVERVPPAGRLFWPRPCFSAWEREELEQIEACQRPEATARSWVRKEAVAKCLGLGLAMPMRHVEVTGGRDDWRLPDRGVQVGDVELRHPFVAAIAQDRQVVPPVAREWRWTDEARSEGIPLVLSPGKFPW